MEKRRDKRLGVVGLGSVGKAVFHGLSYYFDDVKGYDIKGEGNFKDILDTDVVFICVSTDFKDDSLSMTDVENVIERLVVNEYKGIVVVKSTVSIGFTERMCETYQDLRIMYAPEFLREEQAYQFFIYPDRLVFSGTKYDMDVLEDIFSWSNCPVFRMKHKEAEIMKLAHNAKIAVDVSFANEIKMLSDKLGLDSYKIMESIWSDRRRTKYWLNPLKGPYGGKCVEKDSKDYMISTNSKIVKSADYVNRIFRRKQDEQY